MAWVEAKISRREVPDRKDAKTMEMPRAQVD
jgi:hypothetical protein